MENIFNYINGVLQAPVSNQFLENINPATGQVYSLCADSDERDVALAYEAADAAFPIWSEMPANDRSKILLKLAQLIAEKNGPFSCSSDMEQEKKVVNLETETPNETKLNELLDIADLHSEDVSESQSTFGDIEIGDIKVLSNNNVEMNLRHKNQIKD